MKKSFKKYEKAGLPGGPNELKRFTNGFIISERGQWDYPGQPTAVPTPSGRITMKGVENNLLGIDNLGNTQYMTPGNEYQFEGDMVYEIPQAKRGGSKKPSKKFSRSLMAKNRLFAKNPLLKKPKSVKNKIFDPYSPYYQEGGSSDLPQNVGIAYLPEDGRSYYDPLSDTINLNPNASDAELNHELVHAWQNRTGRLRSNPNLPQQRPPIVASDEQAASYYTRKGDEVDEYISNLKNIYPEMTGNIWTEDLDRFIPDQIKYDRAVEPLMYEDANTMEGEAEYLSQTRGRPGGIGFRQEGGFMDVELDDSEIEEYRRGGYIVEDISVPSLTKASYGHSVGNLIRKQKGGEEIPDWAKNHPLVKKTDPNKDNTYENVFEIFDPSGLSSWDDVSRSYSKNGLNGETLLEVIGALPVIGKIGKATSKTIKAVSRGLPLTNKQIRNINNSQKILKYSPKALKAYDAAQAYNEENNPVKKAVIKPEVTVRPKKQEGGSISGTQGLTDDFSQRLTKFILDARAQGVDLGVGSGYRSYEKQKRLWEQAVKKYGSPEKARKWVAPPGGSFHNKGLAVDLNSNGQFLGKDANSKATEWAHANAKKYGLHFRMGHEPWHIEPIEKSKSSSDKENEHDHEGEGDFGGQKITTEDEYNKMVEAKNLEFDLKQKELEERERRLHDDDYSNWTPSKKEDVVNPEQQILDEYSKIIAPSNQNMNALYNANLQRQMKTGGFIVELDDSEIERYKQGGYIIEELPKAQEGIQVGAPVWSNINTNTPVIQNAIPEVERAITERVVVKPEVKAQPVVASANKEKTFEEAHAEARSTLGPNAIFEFNGRKYGTNNPGEDFKPDEKTLEKSGLNTENVKQNIKKQNEELDDPYVSKKTVKVQEKEYEDWDKIKEKNIELNKSSNANKIVKYKTGDKSGKNYVIVDKKKGLLHIYSPGNDKPIFTAPVDLGANKGDAQTTTKVKDTNGDGVIDSIEAQKAKADFSLGNKMTGAGKYYISSIDPEGYGGLPLFNMMNESQYSNYKKTGKVDNVATSFHKGYISDDESRVSNGCIRCNKTTLDNLTKYLQNSSEIFILPEDEGNSFVYENGQLNFKVKNKGDLYTYKNNGKVYKKENNTWYVAPKAGSSFTKITEGSRIKELNKNATNAGYNYYVDSHGKVQKGQGVNKGPTLNYIPIKTSLDEEKFRDEKFTAWDFGDEKELKKVKEFTKSLQDNKQKIMKAAKINGDVYNDIAKITFGIFGTESNYADTHSAIGNFARAVNKKLSPSSSSSPDYQSKYSTYGADEEYRSVGPTQMRWTYLSEDEKKALKEVGIRSNSELMYPSNAALATAVVLGIRYNQQLNDEEKKDIWKSLPKTWNTRANYADRVKDNSKYLILEQKNTKDPKLIAKSNPKDVYTYKGNANAKYKKDKNGNWYINSGSKTNNKFVRLDDPTGARSKLLDANATKLKKFTR
jgi:LAS superfamily LD-carboxypeptidase LdcB